MPIFNLTGDDTLVIYDRVFNDLADGDAVMIAFPSDLVTIKSGKNGNSILAKSEQGNNANMTIRVMRGSSDDQFLAGKLATIQKDFASAEMATGSFVKRMGDGQGSVINDVYTLNGGTFSRKVDGKENVAGDTDQAVSVYNMVFASVSKDTQ